MQMITHNYIPIKALNNTIPVRENQILDRKGKKGGLSGTIHRARIISPLPLRVAKTGRNHLNEEFTPLLPTGIGARF